MSNFNAATARAKRPCPLWIDAFLRDTQHLSADEIGAYLLILMAMWSREGCDYPDDDHRLARLCRVSLRLWKSRIGPVIRPLFRVADGALISKRLRKEAAYVERQCSAQSARKTGENSDKPLNDNEAPPSADTTVDEPADVSPDHPSQQPNIKKRETYVSLARSDDEELEDTPLPKAVKSPSRFDDFWQAYPHRNGVKKGRKPAEVKFAAAVKRGVKAEAIIAGAKAAHAHPDVVRGYARDPATWLQQEGWSDEFGPSRPGGGGGGSGGGYWTSMGYIAEAAH